MFCQGLDSYHCFLAEDGVSVKESCIEKTLILDGTISYFNYQMISHVSAGNYTINIYWFVFVLFLGLLFFFGGGVTYFSYNII